MFYLKTGNSRNDGDAGVIDPIRQLCEADTGETAVLQGNSAFAVGCVRAGIHSVDGYPGTPSAEVIDKGLSAVPDLINANHRMSRSYWTTNGLP